MALLSTTTSLRQLLEKSEGGKKDRDSDVVDAQAAYIGPQLWNYTVPLDDTAVNLSDFLSENSLNEGLTTELENIELCDCFLSQSTCRCNNGSVASDKNSNAEPPKLSTEPPGSFSGDTWGSNEFPVTTEDLILASVPGQGIFDPANRRFAFDELKPQPVLKKAKKLFVPLESKDDKYWERRQKNNVAAKRSRDARRVKENQIGIRAAYLEKENEDLKSLVKLLYEENDLLRAELKRSSVPSARDLWKS